MEMLMMSVLPNQPEEDVTKEETATPRRAALRPLPSEKSLMTLTEQDQQRVVELWLAMEEKMEKTGQEDLQLDWQVQGIPRRRDKKIEMMLERLKLEPDQLKIAVELKDKGGCDGDLVNLVVRSAAKGGNITALKWLQAAGLWDPRIYRHARTAMDAAESGGNLLTLLGMFYLKGVTRTAAEAYYKKLKAELTCKSNLHRGSAALAHYANLIANFVKVRSSVADQIMEDIVAQKALLLSASRESVYVMASSMNFPNHLGTIFVTRQAAFSKETLRYDSSTGRVWCSGERDSLRTSQMAPITLRAAERICALVPADAEHFAYVYGAKWLPVGGYLYLDGKCEAVALNPINFGTGTNAFRFGHAVRCSMEVPSQNSVFRDGELKQERVLDNGGFKMACGPAPDEEFVDGWKRITVQALKDAGASHYIWIPPGDTMLLEEGTHRASSEGKSCSAYGGFAYKMVNRDGSFDHIRFFPLQGSGELIDRGVVGWEVNACELPEPENDEQPDLDEAFQEDTQRNKLEERDMGIMFSIINGSLTNYLSGSRKSTLAENMDHTLTVGTSVRFARLDVPGAVNPNLLHAISVAPRRSVASSLAAKALTTASFRAIFPVLFVDFVLEIFTFCIFWRLIVEKKFYINDFNSDSHQSLWQRTTVVCKLCLLWLALHGLKTTVVELALLREHLARGWFATYLNFTRTISIFNAILVTATLVLFVSSGSLWSGIDHLWGITVAVAFACRLLKVLNFLRPMETLRVGLRIAPILSSLVESLTFLVIVVCMLLFFWGLFWGLSPTARSGTQVLDSMFRLGLLADFSMELDIQTGSNPYDRFFEYGAFVFASIIVSVALMNIFIGMFTSYFDHYQDRVVELFVRHRAQVCATYTIQEECMCKCFGCCRRKGDDTFTRRILFCYNDYDGGAEELENVSIRATLKAAIQEEGISASECVAKLEERVGRLEKLTDDRFGKLERLTESVRTEVSKMATCSVAVDRGSKPFGRGK